MINLILFGLMKTETGVESAPRAKNWVTKAGGRHNLVPGRDLARGLSNIYIFFSLPLRMECLTG